MAVMPARVSGHTEADALCASVKIPKMAALFFLSVGQTCRKLSSCLELQSLDRGNRHALRNRNRPKKNQQNQ
jgi:hypothetical protein